MGNWCSWNSISDRSINRDLIQYIIIHHFTHGFIIDLVILENVNKEFDNISRGYLWVQQAWIRVSKTRSKTAYEVVTEEVWCENKKAVDIANVSCKHHKSWTLINDVTGRKTSMISQLKRDTYKDGIANRYKHFQSLLSKAPDVIAELEEIDPVLTNVAIKRCGEDGMSPEVLKRCELDDTILSNALIYKEYHVNGQFCTLSPYQKPWIWV